MYRGILVTQENMKFIAKLNGGHEVHADALEEPHIFIFSDEMDEARLVNLEEFQSDWTVYAVQEVVVLRPMPTEETSDDSED